MPFSTKSAFDEALSRPLIRTEERESTRGGGNGGDSAAATSARSNTSAGTNAVQGKLPQMLRGDSSPSAASEVGPPADAFPGYRPPASSSLPNQHQDQHESLSAQRQELLLPEQQHLDDAILGERHTELRTLHKSMSQISDIQRDLASIVDSQQQDIDDIEMNAMETAETAARGLTHIEKAFEMLSTRDGRRNALLTGVVTVAMIAAMLYFFLEKSGGGKAANGDADNNPP